MEKALLKYIPKKVLPHIKDLWKDEDGYWATCENGWHFANTQCHTAHGETVQEFRHDVSRIEQYDGDWD